MRRAMIGALAAALVAAPAAGAWTWPVDGPVLQRFVFGDDPYAAGQHRGIDIGAASASPVVAPASGSVSFSGNVPGSGTSITIQTSDGYSVTLTHLGSASVRRGSDVREGDLVGTIGPSGEVEHDVPYVHLGVRRTEDPNGYVDPLLFLPALTAPPAVRDPAPPPPTSAPPAAKPVPPPPPTASAPAASGPAPSSDASGMPKASTGTTTPPDQPRRARERRIRPVQASTPRGIDASAQGSAAAAREGLPKADAERHRVADETSTALARQKVSAAAPSPPRAARPSPA